MSQSTTINKLRLYAGPVDRTNWRINRSVNRTQNMGGGAGDAIIPVSSLSSISDSINMQCVRVKQR